MSRWFVNVCLFKEGKKSGQADQSCNTGERNGTSIGCVDFVGCFFWHKLVQLALLRVETLLNSPANVGINLLALLDDADLNIIGNVGAWVKPLNTDIIL